MEVIEESSSTFTSFDVDEVTTAKGTYFTMKGEAQGGTGRPLLPTASVFDSRPVAGTRIHSVGIRSGTYNLLIDQDPVISNFQQEWVDIDSLEELKTCVTTTMIPTRLGLVNELTEGGATTETFLLTGAQFECTLPPQDLGILDTRGDVLLFDSMVLEAFHPQMGVPDSDTMPPVVTQQDIIADMATGDAMAILDAVDDIDMGEIIVLVHTDLDGVLGGAARIDSFSTGNIRGIPGPYQVFLPGAAEKPLFFQYVDAAGNLLLKSGKGVGIEAIEVLIQTRTIALGLSTIAVEIEGFVDLETPTLTFDFGDDVVQSIALIEGQLPAGVTLEVDESSGNATVFIEHDYTGFSEDEAMVSARVRAVGASGFDEATLFPCSDPVGDFFIDGNLELGMSGDLTQCSFSASGTDVTIDLFVAGAIDSDEFQYRVRLPQFSAQFKYARRKVTSSGGVQLTVGELGDNGLRFQFDAEPLGWDGLTELLFFQETRRGTKAKKQTGSADETQVFSIGP